LCGDVGYVSDHTGEGFLAELTHVIRREFEVGGINARDPDQVFSALI